MYRSKILGLTIGIIILICLAIAGGLSCLNLHEQTQEETQKEELKLSDFPDVFKNDTLIVIGENASQIEKESAEVIAAKLENLTGNTTIIINDTAFVEDNKTSYNLILVGTPKSNNLLQEVYNLTNATKVTAEYPGENKGILEILRNPWNEEKAMLLVEGSDEWGVKAGSEILMEDEKIHGRILTTMLKVMCLEKLLKDTFDNKSVIIEGTVNEVEFYYGPPWLSFFIREGGNRLFVVGPFKVSSEGETGESLPVDKLRELMTTHTTRVLGIYHDQEVFKERPYVTVTKIWIKTDTEYTLIWSYPLNNCPPLNKKEADNQKI